MKIKKYIQKYSSWLIPLLFTAIYLVFLLIWLKLDNSTPARESGRNLYESISFGRLWLNFINDKVSIGVLLANYFDNFPAQNFLVFICYLLFGASSDVAIASNIIWILILSYSVFNLLRNYCSHKMAIALMFLVFSMPYLVAQIFELQKYLPITAWLVLTIYWLHTFKAKADRKRAILFGVVLGVGLLIDRLFIVVNFVVIITIANQMRLREKKHSFINLLAIPIIFMLFISLPWYMANYQIIFYGMGYILHNWSNINFIVLVWPIILISCLVLFRKLLDQGRIIKYLMPVSMAVFILVNSIPFLHISEKPSCNILKIIDYIPHLSTVQMAGDSQDGLDYALGYQLEKAGISWIKPDEDGSHADYWVIKVDGSTDSRQNLFDYYDKGAVVANINCLDSSFMVILKNEKK